MTIWNGWNASDVATTPSTNLAAFLKMIRTCEGTNTHDDEGYRALFGYTLAAHGPLFSGFADHPNVRTAFTQTDGTHNWTTAAGAYQIIYRTWSTVIQPKLKLPDFSPESQDLAAAWLIADADAMDDVLTGRLQMAIDKCSGIWASLPASHYLQPKRSYTFALNAFLQSGGSIA